MHKNVIFVIGNFGIGKSTLIQPWFGTVLGHTKYQCLSEWEGWQIVGTDIGADGVSKYKKVDVMEGVCNSPGNKIVAGCYYQQIVDIKRFENTGHRVYCFYMETSEETNRERVLGRGGKWNQSTYEGKVTTVNTFLRVCGEKDIPVWRVDNSKSKEYVKKEFWKLIQVIEDGYNDL